MLPETPKQKLLKILKELKKDPEKNAAKIKRIELALSIRKTD